MQRHEGNNYLPSQAVEGQRNKRLTRRNESGTHRGTGKREREREPASSPKSGCSVAAVTTSSSRDSEGARDIEIACFGC